MSHHDIFRLGLYHLDTMGWHKTIPPKKDGDEKKVVTMSSCMAVEAKFWHALENTEKIIISNGKDKEHTFDSDILTTRKLPSLIKYGHSINENYIKDLSYALQLMRDELSTSDLYDGSGIIETPHGYIVMIDTIYTSKQYDQLSSLDPIVDSAYLLEPKGTFNDWLNMYINEVKGHLLLELAVVFGISALVTAFLKHKHDVEFAGIIFSFTGQSSTGKSTAASLAVSVAGNPTKGNETLFRSWNATRNALEGYLSNNFGIPIVFDELSSATFKDTTGLLYSIAEGQGRQRSNVHGEVKTPKNWGTSVISTSEYSIFTDSAQNDGLRVRTIEINEQFTTNATNADNIKKAVALNYGHVLPLVAQYLIHREDEVIQWFYKEVDWFEAKLKSETNNTGIRMFKRYAVITTSAKILGRVLATDIDIAKIRDYFIDYHAHTVSERSLADKAIEVITQFVAQNRGKFSDDTALKNMIENYGLIALKDDYIEVKIIASVFKNMLIEHHFQDVNNVVNALRDKGFIESDRDRITTKRTVKDDYGKKQSLVFYHLKLDSEYASIFGLTKDAEPIKAEINLDNKKILESWKKQNDDLIDF
ncbi:cassette chromosome replicative helicase [Staphylococcus aureus]|uniref:cassette chromosome replicative helicase n=1 Tax=Staphylococcus aureus TaxID=1280 RepID=UPI00085C8ECB|nr:membrane protein [Staphylococcus aureus]